ncbi:polysaccharide biosynthesis/export family protein [Tritonibacter mobilis]|uniref:polysaccharide biosynthesis/export family protein n=1 Tax=Tritonibacter mobilis TaxID=379347 RepID=UPI001D0D827C|nr:polysaccharide biosynthesis/export family protein [Tritonibacter mobilis]
MKSRKTALMWRTTKGVALTTALMLPVGCGVVYTSPSVKEFAGSDVSVREIQLTPQTVLLANSTPYSPRNLPREFFSAASAHQGPGLGTLPSAPPIPTESPERMELRLPPEVAVQPYRIGVGDVVLLATKSSGSSIEELSGLLAAQQQRQGYTVSDDGAISIPDIGRVEIGGLTLQEAQDRVFKFLLDNQVDPAFSLEVAEYNSRQVTVGGAVDNAVRVPITLTPLTLGDALTASGGEVIQDEQYASIRIYRGGTIYQIPYDDFLSRPDLRRLRLADGDAVFVDTTYDLDRAFEFYRQEIDVIQLRNQARRDAVDMLASEVSLRRGMLDERRSNFTARTELGAEPRDYVYLTGEVSKQNRIPLPYEQQATLADVLYGNGGFPTETGNASHIYVLRPSPNPSEFGAVTAWHLDAKNSVNLTLATRMEMRPNDMIFIEEQPITKWGRALQQFLPTVLNTAGRAATN